MTLANETFYEDYIYSCNRCKSCTQSAPPRLAPVCAPFEMKGFFGYSGGGKAHIARAIVEGSVEKLEEIQEYYACCTMCMACKQMCPIGLDHYYLIWDVRRHLFDNGVVRAEHAKLLRSVAENNNPWSLPKEEKGEWLISLGVKDLRKERAENLYFVGCASGYKKIAGAGAAAAATLLEKAGVDFGVLGSGETCCGAHACELGDMALFKKLARQNAAAFKELGIKRVIVSDPHCLACFNNNYPDVAGEMPPVEHIFKALAPQVEAGEMTPTLKVPWKLTYHDPCRLSRHAEITDAPRRLLQAVSECEIIEMPRNRESTYCCGNGAGMKEAYPEVTRFAAANRVVEALDAGAEAIVTACPYCKDSLQKVAAEKSGGALKCVDLLQMLADCF